MGKSRVIDGKGNVVYEGSASQANKVWAKMLEVSLNRWYGEMRGKGWKARRPFLFGRAKENKVELKREERRRKEGFEGPGLPE